MHGSLAYLEVPDKAIGQGEGSSLGSHTLHEVDGVVDHVAGPPLSLQSHMHNSDTANRSPWSRKILLSLGMSRRTEFRMKLAHISQMGVAFVATLRFSCCKS